jgi:multidrug resistance protein, MATE family
MLLAEGWAFNVMGVFAGLISVTDQAANTILLMIIAIMFMVPMGIQSAASAIIGEQIGANRVQIAKQYFYVMVYVCVGLLILVQMLIYSFKEQIVGVFTSD